MPIFMILRSDTLLNFFHLSRVRIRSRFFQCITKLTFCQGPPKKNFLRVGGGAWEATPPASQTWEAARLASQKFLGGDASRVAKIPLHWRGAPQGRGGPQTKRKYDLLKKVPGRSKNTIKSHCIFCVFSSKLKKQTLPPCPLKKQSVQNGHFLK